MKVKWSCEKFEKKFLKKLSNFEKILFKFGENFVYIYDILITFTKIVIKTHSEFQEILEKCYKIFLRKYL